MLRYSLILMTVALVHEGTVGIAAADDNPVVRALVRDVVKRELSARDTKEKGWRQGNTWLWLENPPANLAADITSLTLDNSRFALEGRASALIDFQHKVKMLIGSQTFSGQARVYLTFKASAVAGEQLTASKVTIGRLEIHELRLRADAIRPFQGIIQDGINLAIKNNKHDIERRLEEALNRTKLASRALPGR